MINSKHQNSKMNGSDKKKKNNGFPIEISKFTDRPFSQNF